MDKASFVNFLNGVKHLNLKGKVKESSNYKELDGDLEVIVVFKALPNLG
jgi:hypothetical protein